MKLIFNILESPDPEERGQIITIDLEDNGSATLGREPNNALQIRGGDRISRHHLMLQVEGVHCSIRDLGSTNKTFIRRRTDPENHSVQSPPEQWSPIHNGDYIYLGRNPNTRTVAQIYFDTMNMPTIREMLGYCSQCSRPIPDDLLLGDALLICEECRRQGVDDSGITRQFPAITPDYELLEEIGRGGMGIVYKARRITPGHPKVPPGTIVALKIIKPERALNQHERELFKRETDVCEVLIHSHIVQFYDRYNFHKDKEAWLWFAMEYVPGTSADKLLPFPLDDALLIADQILSALEYAHQADIPTTIDGSLVTQQGAVHRDIKPHNILIQGQGSSIKAKLADFGLAKGFQLAGQSRLTKTGETGGTPAFMSPDQILNYRAAKPAADIYSFGATLYTLLTGQLPYDSGDIYLSVLEKPIIPLQKWQPFPKQHDEPRWNEVARIIEKAMQKRSEDRFASAREMRAALAAIRNQPGVAKQPIIRNLSGETLNPAQEALFGQLFSNCQYLDIVQRFSSGNSSSQAFLVIPSKGEELLPRVVKIGPAALIENEWQRYKDYVEETLSQMVRPIVNPPFRHEDLAAVIYSFIGNKYDSNKVYSLLEYYQRHSAPEVLGVLRGLLIDGLGSDWYIKRAGTDKYITFAEFYSHHFPGDLILKIDSISLNQLSFDAAYTYYPSNTKAIKYQEFQPGQAVYLDGFQVEKQRSDRLDLIHPVEAVRLWLNIESGQKDIPTFELGQRIYLRGQVIQNRQGFLADIVATIFADIDVEVDPTAATINLAGRIYPNPLTLYQTYLNQSLPPNLATIHGDLHMENIIVDQFNKPWLIDFGKVTKKGHVIFDFIELETHVRHATIEKNPSLKLVEMIEFERRLLCASLSLQSPPAPPSHADLAKAYEVILGIRTLATDYMVWRNDFGKEYFLALFLYVLSTLRFRKYNGAHSTRHAFVTAAILAAFLKGQLDCRDLELTKKAVKPMR